MIDRIVDNKLAADFLNLTDEQLGTLADSGILVPFKKQKSFCFYKLSSIIKYDARVRKYMYTTTTPKTIVQVSSKTPDHTIEVKNTILDHEKDFSHNDLIQIATNWLLKEKKCEIILQELRLRKRGEIPDVIGWDNGGCSYKIECKISNADFMNEWKKDFNLKEKTIGSYKWVMCPSKMIFMSNKLLPKWGMLEVFSDSIVKEKVIATPDNHISRSYENAILRKMLVDISNRVKNSALGRIVVPNKRSLFDKVEMYSVCNSQFTDSYNEG